MKINKKKIGLGLALIVLSTISISATDTGKPPNNLSDVLGKFFDESAQTIKLGGLIASLYGAYKLFFAEEKTPLNWFLFVGGAGFIGAYPTFTKFIVDFAA